MKVDVFHAEFDDPERDRMKNLTTYVDSCINLRCTDINNINQKIAYRIFDSLDGDLSPENLSLYSLISAAAARRQEKFLYKAGYELLKLGFKPSNTWSEFAYRNAADYDDT